MRLFNAVIVLSTIASTVTAFSLQHQNRLQLQHPQQKQQQNAISNTQLNVLADDETLSSPPSQERTPLGMPGTAKMDKEWGELGFEFRPTKSHLRITYKDGEWGEMELNEVSLSLFLLLLSLFMI